MRAAGSGLGSRCYCCFVGREMVAGIGKGGKRSACYRRVVVVVLGGGRGMRGVGGRSRFYFVC
jgi:hypothetical protein